MQDAAEITRIANAASKPGYDWRGRDVRTIAVVADIGSNNLVEHIVRKARPRLMRPLLIPFFSVASISDIVEIVPELAGAIVISETACLDAFIRTNLATVLVHERLCSDATVDQVILDTEMAGFRVAEYIASAGRTSVGLVGPHSSDSRVFEGFLKGVQTYDLVLPKDSILTCPPERELAAATFRTFLRSANAFPQVVYCTDADVACGVQEALAAEGFKVPDDIWVLAQGESTMTKSPFYDITSNMVHMDILSDAVLNILCSRMNDVDHDRIIRQIAFDIVARSTTDNFQMAKAAQ